MSECVRKSIAWERERSDSVRLSDIECKAERGVRVKAQEMNGSVRERGNNVREMGDIREEWMGRKGEEWQSKRSDWYTV